jgi:acetolactate synthase-1/2/3 large subunit
MKTVGEEIGSVLRSWGVRWVFGHPGGEVVDLIEAFRSTGLEFLLTHHETAAAIMAATVGDLTQIPGVVVTTLGPGATNMVTGVAQAFLDRSPMVAFAAQLPSAWYPITPHQRIDLQSLFRPITKASAAVSEENVATCVRWALRMATEGIPGPVFLEIPSDVVTRQATPLSVPYPSGPPSTASSTYSTYTSVAKASEMLTVSGRPVVIFGWTAARMPLISAAARAFVEARSTPFIHTPKAKGIVREDHPLYAGTIEMAGTSRLSALLRKEVDLVVMVGVDAVEFDMRWDFPMKVLHLDERPSISGYSPVHHEVLGDVVGALRALAEQKDPEKWRPAEIEEVRTSLVDREQGREEISSVQAVAAARDLLPEDTIFVSDTGTNKMVAGQVWKAFSPLTYLVSNGLSTMGYALPAAAAAKLVFPERPVLAVMGDGGLLMEMGEMATAARLGVGIDVMVLVDNALDAIRRTQRSRGLPVRGTEFKTPSLANIAREMGWQAISVTTESALRGVLAFRGTTSTPLLIEVLLRNSPVGGSQRAGSATLHET